MTLGLRHADARDQRRCKLAHHLPILRSDRTSVRLPFRLNQPIIFRSRLTRLWVSFKKNGIRVLRALPPTAIALTLVSVAHAQGTMDFSGAQTLMGTFKTFAVYAGAVICFGGLIFAGIRMMSGRFQLTAPNRELGVANRDLGTITRFGDDGRITVSMDGGKKTVTFDPHEMRHFDHGYAVTSHSSQGLTSERVLVNMDTRVHPELINSRFAYVSVSRASFDAQIFTNNATTLAESLSRDVSKESAVDVSNAVKPALVPILDTKQKTVTSNGLGLAL
jgi:hypothetical protein